MIFQENVNTKEEAMQIIEHLKKIFDVQFCIEKRYPTFVNGEYNKGRQNPFYSVTSILHSSHYISENCTII